MNKFYYMEKTCTRCKKSKNIEEFKKNDNILKQCGLCRQKNIDRNKTSVGEIVGYTTSLVSIIALIKSL